jgi:hypothetical protein
MVGQIEQSTAAMPPPQWLASLEAAPSPDEVVRVARGYLETWTALEVAPIRPGYFPFRIENADQVANVAVRLILEHLNSRDSLADSLLLERLMVFFTHASSRLTRLGHISKGHGERVGALLPR